jgi:hypothetical protein
MRGGTGPSRQVEGMPGNQAMKGSVKRGTKSSKSRSGGLHDQPPAQYNKINQRLSCVKKPQIGALSSTFRRFHEWFKAICYRIRDGSGDLKYWLVASPV